MARETSSINLFESWNTSSVKPAKQVGLGAPVRVRPREFSRDDSGDLRLSGLGIGGVHAVVPDHRRGHHHRLTAIRRIGEDFLVARHVGGEDYLGDGWLISPEEASAKKGSILEEEEPFSSATQSHVSYGFLAGGFSAGVFAPFGAVVVAGADVAGAALVGAGVKGMAGFAPPAGALTGAVAGGVENV